MLCFIVLNIINLLFLLTSISHLSQSTEIQGAEVEVTVEDVVKLIEDLSRLH